MQGKKILITVLMVLSLVLVLLIAIPMRRTYNAEVVVNSDELITYRTLQDTTNWDKWYFDPELPKPRPTFMQMSAAKKTQVFDYVLKDQNGYEKAGQIKVSKKDRWSMRIDWSEEFTFRTNIFKKLHLLFNPSEYRATFLENMVHFKGNIEHPENIFGGLTFNRVIVPAGNLIKISDTISLHALSEEIGILYNRLTTQLTVGEIKNPGTFLSQHETLNDTTAVLSVAVEITDAISDIKEPFELLEMDAHPAVVIQTQKSYTEMEDDIAIMYRWLKKNDKRPATGYWIRHSPSTDIAQTSTRSNLTIIQEVYSIK